MKKELPENIKKIMEERFGKDSIIALATVKDGMPYVRNVDGYYEDGVFYVLTYALSDKMKHIERDPLVAIAGEWFTAHGTGENLGWFRKKENEKIAEKMRKLFAEWIDNGHNDFDDENTCILRIQLTDGVLLSHGTRYELVFSEK